jgi:hypothetical protein
MTYPSSPLSLQEAQFQMYQGQCNHIQSEKAWFQMMAYFRFELALLIAFIIIAVMFSYCSMKGSDKCHSSL